MALLTGCGELKSQTTFTISKPAVKIDTVPCIMVVCDTSRAPIVFKERLSCEEAGCSGMNLSEPKHFKHFTLTEGNGLNSLFFINGYSYNLDEYKVRHSYLGADKKRLPKNIIVWISKPLNPQQ